jgi:hypothetical protein
MQIQQQTLVMLRTFYSLCTVLEKIAECHHTGLNGLTKIGGWRMQRNECTKMFSVSFGVSFVLFYFLEM